MTANNALFRTVRQRVLQDSGDTRIGASVRFAALTAALALGVWLIYFSTVTTTWPFQIEFREGAPLVMTRLLLEGKNPFSLENQPLAANNYGILYSLSVVPVAAVLGNTLLAHRAVTVLFILLSCFLVFRESYTANRDWGPALAGAELVMVGLASLGGLGAFPGSMGTFFFLAALLIPFHRGFDSRGLTLSAFLCVLAFYTKPYFVLAFGIVASYVFLFASKKKALGYGALFAAALLASVFLVKTLFPLYFVDTFVSNLSQSEVNVWGQVRWELKTLAIELAPSLIAAAAVLLAAPRRILPGSDDGAGSHSRAKLQFLDRPLFLWRLDYFFYALLCSLLAFVLVLGPHTYNPLNALPYSYQLVIPPFFLWLCTVIKPRTWLGLILTPLLVINAAYFSLAWLSPAMLNNTLATRGTWQKLEQSICNSSHILNSPVIVSEIMRRGIWPVDSGQTEFYFEIRDYPHMELVGPGYQAIRDHGDLYLHSLRAGVREQTYDCIILTQYDAVNATMNLAQPQNNLTQHYRQEQTMNLLLPLTHDDFHVSIWSPTRE